MWDRTVWDCRVVVVMCVEQNCVGLSCGGGVVGSIVMSKNVGKPVTQMSLIGQTLKEVRCLCFGTPEAADCAVFIFV